VDDILLFCQMMLAVIVDWLVISEYQSFFKDHFIEIVFV